MNVLILNIVDISGGAARSAYRMHKGLQNAGIKSQMLVNLKVSDDYSVIGSSETKFKKGLVRIIFPFLDSIPLSLYPGRNKSPFCVSSVNFLPTPTIVNKINEIDPDIVHLNWIGSSFLKIELLRCIKEPVVWTLHDMWAFSGGCHYDEECGRYKVSCGRCPILGSNREKDLSWWIWYRKKKSWKDLNITVVTPSKWLAECARVSSLFKNIRIEVIPYGLDTNQFKPICKNIARELLQLPLDKKIILFSGLSSTGGYDPRKGFHLLLSALRKIKNEVIPFKLELAVFGASESPSPPDLGFPVNYLGYLNHDTLLALAYSAADVFVAPSMQENFANTVLESLACGTPVVAFNIGGMPDMIEHKQNGYLAKPFDCDDLAQGITWVLEDDMRHKALSERTREKVLQEFTLEIQAKKYINLYNDILGIK